MSPIKDKKEIKRISANNKADTPKNICFSFSIVSNNKSFGFDSFGKDIRKKIDAYDSLYEKLKDMSGMSLDRAHSLGKDRGYEMLPLSAFSEGIRGICGNINFISAESKLAVFRFHNQDYRCICKSDPNMSNLMYIIAYDFDYSAYDHG